MVIGNVGTSPTLGMELMDPTGRKVSLFVPGLLQAGQWCHLAVSTGPGGVRLYFNGVQVGGSPYAGSFATIQNGDHNFLGRNNWKAGQPGLPDLHGQRRRQLFAMSWPGSSSKPGLNKSTAICNSSINSASVG
jgi:hypothetical protein